MLKLSEIRGEAALDVLADIMEPAVEIMTDAEVKTLFRQKKKVEAIALMIKNHKRATIAIMAALNQKSVDEFMATVMLDDGTLLTRIDTGLGTIAQRKARGN